MQLKSPIWYNGAKGGLMIRTSSIACILYPIKESKAEAIQLFGRPDTWPCIPQAQDLRHRHKHQGFSVISLPASGGVELVFSG